MTVLAMLCELEIQNHRGVIALLLRALSSTVPPAVCIQVADELKARRGLIAGLQIKKKSAQTRRSMYRDKLV